MSVSDYYEGQPAGSCGCGRPLIRSKIDGVWRVVHADDDDAASCRYESARFSVVH